MAEQEIRLALVFYGGVSLAIYENGVAQEMLRLVRSTCAAGPKSGSTEEIYAELAQMLDAEFIIDVLAGTSAGGINAVYLAKAIANGQTLDNLKQLWFDEANLDTLLNDAESVKEEPLPKPRHPASLLNGQRMYRKLLIALENMELTSGPPLVKELDLFVTATNLDGLPVRIALTDQPVFERVFKNNFHFRFSPQGNDFERSQNPMLAFAARCTSAFPFAFEPMSLNDIAPVLATLAPYANQDAFKPPYALYRKYFDEASRASGAASIPFADRSFADGGYMQNKPFTLAIRALVDRSPNRPTERKLYYVEPEPEHPEMNDAPVHRPDAVENLIAAAVSIPRYQTIREDLQGVLDRNITVARVNRVLRQIDRDTGGETGFDQVRLKPGEWETLDLHDLATRYGRAYLAYNSLKLSVVTEDIASMVARVFSIGTEESTFRAVVSLMLAWREKNYVGVRTDPADQRPTFGRFLMDFDLRYRLRRIRFAANRCDEFSRAGERSLQTLTSFGISEEVGRSQEFRDEIRAIKPQLNVIGEQLRACERILFLDPIEGHPLFRFRADPPAEAASLESILRIPRGAVRLTEEQCLRNAGEFLDRHTESAAKFHEMADTLRSFLKATILAAAEAMKTLSATRRETTDARRAAWKLIDHFYKHFEDYDATQFPVLYGTGIEDAAAVDVHRISPDDAPRLVDEGAERRKPSGSQHRKLFGTKLAAFGGFLERPWRENDMLWGRLDAAERLISTLLPGANWEEKRESLIDRAHATIVAEELASNRTRTAVERIASTNNDAALLPFLKSLLDPRQMLSVYRENLALTPDPERGIRNLSRTTTITGKLLEGIAEEQQIDRNPARWLTRFGSLFFGLVQVAAPHSMPALIFRYWLQVLYLLGIAMVLLGWAFDRTHLVAHFGIGLLAVVALLHLGSLFLGDALTGSTRRFRWAARLMAFLFLALLLGLAVVGAIQVASVLRK